ncbi:MAG: [Clostridia bacterium]|nr:[FeFe] hydrogenase H-cluster radical SAM maturase HydE [Clostridia bacterium]
MKNNLYLLIDKLASEHSLSCQEYELLLDGRTPELSEYAAKKAVELRQAVYGNDVYIRGLIEISNICKNDCLYCGIRHSNKSCVRYRLSEQEILSCCEEGYTLGFRTFVLQGGEDPFFTDEFLCGLISNIKNKYPDCAVTLSLGERSFQSYKALFEAGADRYLLRHETADPDLYRKLHPENMSLENRLKCLKNLKEIGYQTGCGFMVRAPYQTNRSLAMDLKFVEEFRPDMCGIGPFIPHAATPFCEFPSGTLEETLFLLSLLRLIDPTLLLPATTALGTIDANGREKGILAGANVVMPNLSPVDVRKKYELYNNKICTGEESAQAKEALSRRMEAIGYKLVTDRGDRKEC